MRVVSVNKKIAEEVKEVKEVDKYKSVVAEEQEELDEIEEDFLEELIAEEEVKVPEKVKSRHKENVCIDKYGYCEELFDDAEPTPYGLQYRGLLDAYNKDDLDSEELDGKNNVLAAINEVVEHFTITDPIALSSYERGVLPKEDFIKKAIEHIKNKGLGEKVSLEVLDGFQRYMWSYGVLDELIDDDDISDIKVLGRRRIRVKRNGKRETSHLKFLDDKAVENFVARVAIKNKVSISDKSALVNFTDKTSSDKFILRFNISTKFVNSVETPYLHIRKIAKFKVTIEELIRRKMMSPAIARYLRWSAANSTGMMFTGKGASGKTTCMNALIDLIPVSKSVSVMQENEELFSYLHPDMEFKHVVQNSGEGKVEYTLQDLARNGLLTDLDYFIIGEIKGGEALYLLNAVYTGAVGWASVHGASSTEAMKKLADYIKYESDYSAEDAMKMLVYMKTVVFLKDYKVWEISEIVGWNDKKNELIYKPIVVDGELVVKIGKHGEVLD